MAGRLYDAVETAAFALARTLAAFGLLLLIAYAGMTLLDGLMRSLANRPIELVRDVDGVVVAAAMSCCFPIAYQMRSNICIKFAGMMLGRQWGRLLDAFASVLMTVIAVLMAWQLFLFARAEAVNGDATVMLEIRTAPFWYFVSFIMAFAAFVQMLTALSDIRRCFGAAEDAPAPPQQH
jgi:TRAP-type C4-dicarboxylate transport system permease small subunit